MTESHGWTDYPASFALGALDEDERAAFEAHLAGCEACRAAVQAFRETAASLALAAPVQEPPAGLRARILHEAASVRPIGSARPRPAVGTARAAGEAGPRGGVWRGTRWLAAASLVLAVGAAALLVRERAVRAASEQTVAQLRAEALADAERLATLGAEVSSRDSLLAAVLAPDSRTVRLSAQGRPPSARIFWSAERGRVVVAAFELDPAPAGRTYQLWGIAGGQAPVSLGVFNTGPDGRVVAAFDVGQAMRFDVAAVTEEPAGGSPQPTMNPFLVGGLGL